jgi:hypothetical protein
VPSLHRPEIENNEQKIASEKLSSDSDPKSKSKRGKQQHTRDVKSGFFIKNQQDFI